ncbi:MAG: PDZ domain-containing protein, partial [Caldilineaceae bacterium]|nr:PDZ domain-containing protein [Caldilineaceae bacterium]
MEKRHVLFITTSMLLLIGYQIILQRLNPPPPVEQEVVERREDEEDLAADNNNLPADEDETATPQDADSAAGSEATPDPKDGDSAVAEVAANDAATDDAATSDAERGPPSPLAWTTLGTLDPQANAKMLVWLCSRGASIECIALNDSNYSDLDDHHGYLGYLAVQQEAVGLRIGAVGPGTPAAVAAPQDETVAVGLQAGDVLQGLDGVTVRTRQEFDAWMATTQPGQNVAVEVRRPGEDGGEERTLTFTTTLIRRPLEVIRPEPLDAPSRTDY